MARLNLDEIRERVFGGEDAYLCYYTNDDGKVEYSIENTRSSSLYPDDIRITKKQFEAVLDELKLDGHYLLDEIWDGYGTYKYNREVR